MRVFVWVPSPMASVKRLKLWCWLTRHDFGIGKGHRFCARCGEDWWNVNGR